MLGEGEGVGGRCMWGTCPVRDRWRVYNRRKAQRVSAVRLPLVVHHIHPDNPWTP